MWPSHSSNALVEFLSKDDGMKSSRPVNNFVFKGNVEIISELDRAYPGETHVGDFGTRRDLVYRQERGSGVVALAYIL